MYINIWFELFLFVCGDEEMKNGGDACVCVGMGMGTTSKKKGGKERKDNPKNRNKKHTDFVLYQSMNPKESHLRLFRYN